MMRSKFPLPKAVVTTSRVVRGIVTATSWLGSNVRAFAPSNIDEAFDYLDVPKPLRAGLLERVALLKRRPPAAKHWRHFRRWRKRQDQRFSWWQSKSSRNALRISAPNCAGFFAADPEVR